jgi:hypothetical protein
MTRKHHWRSERALHWIEEYCVVPNGAFKGKPVRLSAEQRETLCSVYDDNAMSVPVVTGELAAFVALLHLCGPEAVKKGFTAPPVETDSFSVWAAAQGGELQAVLRRRGEAIICPELGTAFPKAA